VVRRLHGVARRIGRPRAQEALEEGDDGFPLVLQALQQGDAYRVGHDAGSVTAAQLRCDHARGVRRRECRIAPCATSGGRGMLALRQGAAT
jgi:hypothetical protein